MSSPTYWPGQADHEEVGPIGDGTPHARMYWFWERMKGHEGLIEELTGWHGYRSDYRFEAAIADAFDKLAAERPDAAIIEAARKFLAARVALVEAKFTRRESSKVTMPLALAEGEAADALREAVAQLEPQP